MEDKRITKTKRNLKQTMKEMLVEMPLAQIHVTDLCRRACTSRITFYTYFGDKQELLYAVFEDLYEEMRETFSALQRQNNPESETGQSYRNLLKCMFKLNEDNAWLFRTVDSGNVELSLTYYTYLIRRIEEFGIHYRQSSDTHPYDIGQLSAFLTLGFVGFRFISEEKHLPTPQIEEGMLGLMDELIHSPVFQ